MEKHTEAEITNTSDKSYTRITFKPDLKKFKLDRLQEITPLL